MRQHQSIWYAIKLSPCCEPIQLDYACSRVYIALHKSLVGVGLI